MTFSYDQGAPRRAANLRINSDLIDRARAAGLNLSQTLEAALVARLRELEAERWQRENADAIGAYNERVAANGSFGARHKRF